MICLKFTYFSSSTIQQSICQLQPDPLKCSACSACQTCQVAKELMLLHGAGMAVTCSGLVQPMCSEHSNKLICCQHAPGIWSSRGQERSACSPWLYRQMEASCCSTSRPAGLAVSWPPAQPCSPPPARQGFQGCCTPQLRGSALLGLLPRFRGAACCRGHASRGSL